MTFHRITVRLLMFAGLTGCAAQSQSPVGDLLHTFSACDSSFFNTLKSDKASVTPAMDLTETDLFAYPAYGSTDIGRMAQTFKQPIPVNGVALQAYQSSYEQNALGKHVLYWGFIVQGAPTAVYAALSPLFTGNHHALVYNGGNGGGYVWAEARQPSDPQDQWTRTTTSYQQPPAPGVIQHGLILANNGAGTTKLLCTLQGDLTPELTKTFRPDIGNEILLRATTSTPAPGG